MNEIIELFKKNGFELYDYEIEEMKKYKELEIVRKAYGDSYEKDLYLVLGDDHDRVIELAEKHGIDLPSGVWYD